MPQPLRTLVLLAILAASALQAKAATYYVRPDGGNASQCTGLADAAYPGTGQGLDCAWNHPFQALTGNPPAWRIQGGDRLLINVANYRMGYGAPNTGACESDYPWDCRLPPLPAGPDPAHPTILAGRGHSLGCPRKPVLYGVERSASVIDLTGSDNAMVACLEITDHSPCVEFHSDPGVACNRDTFPYGDWAQRGILASDAANLTLADLDIHGLANTGVLAARLQDLTVTDTRIAANGWVGWNGDMGLETSSYSGTLAFSRLAVEYNGCAESWPGEEPANCWSQSQGGYGDGMGLTNTGGHWIFEDSSFTANTSDGLDLLYVGRGNNGPTQIEISRTRAVNNAGNQLKTSGPATLTNILAVSGCSYFENKPFAPDIGGNPAVDPCRAGGNTLSVTVFQGNRVDIVNATLAGQGDCQMSVECDSEYGACDGGERVTLANSLSRGYADYLQEGDLSCHIWSGDPAIEVRSSYNVVQAKVGGGAPLGEGDIQASPGFGRDDLWRLDPRLKAGGPAVDSGLPVGGLSGLVPADDLEGQARPLGAGVNRGALERLFYTPAPQSLLVDQP